MLKLTQEKQLMRSSVESHRAGVGITKIEVCRIVRIGNK